MTNPWDRRPKETDAAWQAFQTYRDLGPDRSVASAVKAAGLKPATSRSWERMASRHAWRERVVAWDTHMDSVVQARIEKEHGEMASRHVKLGKNLQAVSGVVLREWARRLEANEVDLSEVPVEVLSKLTRDASYTAKIGVDVERLAVGASTENVRHEGTVVVKKVDLAIKRPDPKG